MKINFAFCVQLLPYFESKVYFSLIFHPTLFLQLVPLPPPPPKSCNFVYIPKYIEISLSMHLCKGKESTVVHIENTDSQNEEGFCKTKKMVTNSNIIF